MLGLTRREVEERFDEIVDFAELREFIDAPVKTYSSGMYMRLGFSVAIHVAPDALRIDADLASGAEPLPRQRRSGRDQRRRRGEAPRAPRSPIKAGGPLRSPPHPPLPRRIARDGGAAARSRSRACASSTTEARSATYSLPGRA